ncbi:transcription factor, RsfA family [Marininema mesophilum]|uniref:Transcription factor, RsfA family n=1 Tax=Marininema mesophilum TaxID=1048340 RepID=A0A1H3CA03_9BACL|nr:hypothetical protein [Marininema mesophilum]SDX50905.1 transcription factor, RsfA family [Marininema mesophilum]
MKGRCWTQEEDRLLAETVLQWVREGGNQLDAFAEVGRIINRTAGACGFRWNAVVRKQENEAFRRAKQERVASQLKRKRENYFSMRDVVGQLKDFEGEYRDQRERLRNLEKFKKDKDRILREAVLENRRLQEHWNSFQQFQEEIKDRYTRLLKLLETARVADYGEDGEVEDELESSERADVMEEGTTVDTERETHS